MCQSCVSHVSVMLVMCQSCVSHVSVMSVMCQSCDLSLANPDPEKVGSFWPPPQALPRFYLAAMEKNQEKAWDQNYIQGFF